MVDATGGDVVVATLVGYFGDLDAAEEAARNPGRHQRRPQWMPDLRP
ncbi:MAG TPA: hypothetical protein VES02_07955 [Dermatophilaceae bacterium]|nr:hypothetical protein [Dermatophilaceae bacterium]